MDPSPNTAEPAARRRPARDDPPRRPARSRRRAGREALDRLGLGFGGDRGAGAARPAATDLPKIPSVTTIRFPQDAAEWGEDSSVSGDSYVNFNSKSMVAIEVPSIEQLRDVGEESLLSSGSDGSKHEHEGRESKQSKMAKSLYMVAAKSDGASGRPAHWAAAEEVDAEEEGPSPLDLRTLLGRGQGGGDANKGTATAARPHYPGADPSPDPDVYDLQHGICSVQSDDESRGSSKLWDRLEGGSLPGEGAGAGPAPAQAREAPAGASAARWRVRAALGVAAAAAVAVATLYLAVDAGEHAPVFDFLLRNNFLGRVFGGDDDVSRTRRLPQAFERMLRQDRRGHDTLRMDPLAPPAEGDPQGTDHLDKFHRQTMVQGDPGYYHGGLRGSNHLMVGQGQHDLPPQDYGHQIGGHPPEEEAYRTQEEMQYHPLQDRHLVHQDFADDGIAQGGVAYQP